MMRTRKTLRPTVEGMESRILLSGSGGGTSSAIVTGLFREVLQRNPDHGSLVKFERQLDTGGSVQQVASTLYASLEFRRDEVVAYYEHLLGRDPTLSELRKWASVLIAGAPEERVVDGIASSHQYFVNSGGNDTAFVRALYLDLLGRQADPSGLAAYVSQLDSGMTFQTVAGEFTATTEYRELKVREVYQVVLNRAPGSGELTGRTSSWSALGGLEGVTVSVLSGPENLARIAQTGGIPLPDLTAAHELGRILQAPYSEQSTGFVELYNSLLGTRKAHDSKGKPIVSPPGNKALWTLMKTGGATDGLPLDELQTVTPMDVNVGSLIPLQSEIDIYQSLHYVLGLDPAKSDLKTYLTGGVITPHGGPIITGGGGTYVVDGHHRWSSIYVINPNAQVKAFDLGYEKSPLDYLKITQMAVGAELGFLPVQSVQGKNLLTISRKDFNTWVTKDIQDGPKPQAVIDVFKQAMGLNGIAEIADYLWANVERMRKFNRPVPGVTSRDYMPQPPDTEATLQLLETGQLDYRFPVIAQLG